MTKEIENHAGEKGVMEEKQSERERNNNDIRKCNKMNEKSHTRQEMPRAASHSSGNSGRGDFVKTTTAEYQHAENGEKKEMRDLGVEGRVGT